MVDTQAIADRKISLNLDITEQLAGGPDPDRFDCLEVWYPIAYLEDLDRTKLTPFTLLERDLVIWWDGPGQSWRVFLDQCPHRLAPLSQGRIAEDGLLECPYHGWAFTGTGACDRIPQQRPEGTAEQSPRACAKSLPVAERQGLLFVYPGQPDRAPHVPVPIVGPLEEEPEKWVLLNTFRDLPYDALTLLENVLDSSHLPYTHHRSVGNRANAAPVELELLESGKQGFRGLWEEGPRRGKLGRQFTTFIAPGLMWHDLTSKQFGRTLTVVYATPIRKGECRLFARFPFQFSSKVPEFFIKLTPRWYSHLGQNAILEDDQIFLHYQERYLEAAGGGANAARAFYLPTGADRFVLALRNWANQFQADPFPGRSLPPALPIPSLLDRYTSHTSKCGSCSKALRTIQRMRFGVAIAAALLWITLPATTLFFPGQTRLLVLATTALVLGLGAGWLWLTRLQRRFYEGREIPPRNLPERARP